MTDAVGGNPPQPPLGSRAALALASIAAILAAFALRGDRPIEIAAAVSEARRLSAEASGEQSRLLAAFDAGDLSDTRLADAIERETSPLLQAALRRIDEAQAHGAEGSTFEDFSRSVRLRHAAAESLVASLRASDARVLAVSRRTWEEADRLAARFGAAPDAPRFAVIGH